METFVEFRSAAVVVGGLLALVVVGIIVARLLRSRASRTPPLTMEPPPGASDPAYLDSSHIIAGSPAEAAERMAQGDVAAKPGGPGPGPRQ
jgi:hypothetical protein